MMQLPRVSFLESVASQEVVAAAPEASLQPAEFECSQCCNQCCAKLRELGEVLASWPSWCTIGESTSNFVISKVEEKHGETMLQIVTTISAHGSRT